MSPQAQRIDAVIFDLDDTLIDWSSPAVTWNDFVRPKTEAIYDHLDAAGHRLPPVDEFIDAIDTAVRATWDEARTDWTIRSMDAVLAQVFAQLALNAKAIDMGEVLRVYSWAPFPGVELFPDTIEVLRALRGRGYKIGLVTNSFLPMWMRDVELEKYELIDLFDARLSSGDVGYLKPHPRIYEHMLEMLATTPERAVFVGDRPANDIAGANEAGLISVLFDPPHLERELDGVVPDYTIATLSELPALLEDLEREEHERREARPQ